MKIVILDGYTTNPGDESWKRLEALGELTVYDHTEPEQILPRTWDAEAVITNKTPLTRELLEGMESLRYLGTLSTGFNVIDLETARRLNVPVCNVPAYCTKAVAQMTFALLLELTNHVHLHSQSVRAGRWGHSKEFCYWEKPLIELEHKTMGILGFGSIGRAAAQIALAMGMKVLVYSRTPKELPSGCEWVDLKELFTHSDVVSVHCPLTPQTEGMINRELLSLMKPTAFLLNTSRGQVINERDLADALNQGRLAGAGLDVLAKEPPAEDNPLITAKNCVITPHVAWAAGESRQRLIDMVAENLEAFLRGKPQNVVNGWRQEAK